MLAECTSGLNNIACRLLHRGRRCPARCDCRLLLKKTKTKKHACCVAKRTSGHSSASSVVCYTAAFSKFQLEPACYRATVFTSGDDRQRRDRQSFQFVNTLPRTVLGGRTGFVPFFIRRRGGKPLRDRRASDPRPESAGFFFMPRARARVWSRPSSLILIGSHPTTQRAAHPRSLAVAVAAAAFPVASEAVRRLLRAAQQPPSV